MAHPRADLGGSAMAVSVSHGDLIVSEAVFVDWDPGVGCAGGVVFEESGGPQGKHPLAMAECDHHQRNQIGATTGFRQHRHRRLSVCTSFGCIDEGVLLALVTASLIVLVVGVCCFQKWRRRNPSRLGRCLPHGRRTRRLHRVQHCQGNEDSPTIHRKGVELGDLESAGLAKTPRKLSAGTGTEYSGSTHGASLPKLNGYLYPLYDKEGSEISTQKCNKAIANAQAKTRSAVGTTRSMADVDLEDVSSRIEACSRDATAADVHHPGRHCSIHNVSGVLASSNPPQAIADDYDSEIEFLSDDSLEDGKSSSSAFNSVCTSVESFGPRVLHTSSPNTRKFLNMMSQETIAPETSPILPLDPRQLRITVVCDGHGGEERTDSRASVVDDRVVCADRRKDRSSSIVGRSGPPPPTASSNAHAPDGICDGYLASAAAGLWTKREEMRSRCAFQGDGSFFPDSRLSKAGAEARVVHARDLLPTRPSISGLVRDLKIAASRSPTGPSLSSLASVLEPTQGLPPVPALGQDLDDDMCYSDDDDEISHHASAVSTPESDSCSSGFRSQRSFRGYKAGSGTAVEAATKVDQRAAFPPPPYSRGLKPEVNYDDGGFDYSPTSTDSGGKSYEYFRGSAFTVFAVERGASLAKKAAGDALSATSDSGSCFAVGPRRVDRPTAMRQRVDGDGDAMSYSSSSTESGTEERTRPPRLSSQPGFASGQIAL